MASAFDGALNGGGTALESMSVTVLAEDSVLYGTPFLGQHGLSLYIETLRDGQVDHALMDVGQNPLALVNNMEDLDIDLDDLDAVVLTHCHHDHTGGVAQILGASANSEIPVIAHPSIFRPHYGTEAEWRHVGMAKEDSEERIKASGGKMVFTKDPMPVVPGLYVSGQIPRTNGLELPPRGLFTSVGAMAVPDKMDDDMSLYGLVEGAGMVVMTGCAHAGIINILDYGAKLFPGWEIEGILGGLHLIDGDEDLIRWTAESIKKRNPRWVGAGHCTGFGGQMALAAVMEENFFPLRTGITVHIDKDGMEIESVTDVRF